MRAFYDRIAKWFPLPKILVMRHAGVHISSDNHLIMMILKEKRGSLVPDVHMRIPFEVKDDDYVVSLREALKSAKIKQKVDFVKVSVSERKSYLFESEIPKVEEKDMALAVAATIEEKAPVSLSQVLFGYKVIEEVEDDRLNVCVGVVPKAVIDELIESFTGAEISPITFKIEAQAVANAVIPKNSKENAIVVSVKRHKTIIALVKNGGVFMSTTVEFGGDIFDTILTKAGHDKEMVKYLKFSENFFTANHGDEVKQNIQSSYIEQINLLKNHINKYYVYWLTHEANKGETKEELGRMIIVGEESCMPGFLDYLGQNFETKVEAGNVWTNCFDLNKYIPEIPLQESFAYAEAVGLLIEHE